MNDNLFIEPHPETLRWRMSKVHGQPAMRIAGELSVTNHGQLSAGVIGCDLLTWRFQRLPLQSCIPLVDDGGFRQYGKIEPRETKRIRVELAVFPPLENRCQTLRLSLVLWDDLMCFHRFHGLRFRYVR